MTNPTESKSKFGCGGVIAVLIVLGLSVALVELIARGFTNLAIWAEYGSGGLPAGATRSAAHPLGWVLFLGVIACIASERCMVRYERNRRRRFQAYVTRVAAPTHSG
jgi:hypothetical protein